MNKINHKLEVHIFTRAYYTLVNNEGCTDGILLLSRYRSAQKNSWVMLMFLDLLYFCV